MLPRKNSDNKYIYIVFIVTNTNMGKLIRFFTRNQYSHVTLSFDGHLQKMYSFARYHINSPISGGFVTELPERYLNGNSDVMLKICELPVTNEDYIRIHKEISYFSQNKEEMIYNTLNAVLSLLKKRVPVKNTYTCLEFVNYLLKYQNIVAISELERRLEDHVIYCGSFKEIIKGVQPGQPYYCEEDEYFRRRQVIEIILDTVYHFRKIAVRLLAD